MTTIRHGGHGSSVAANVAIAPAPGRRVATELIPRILSGLFLILTALVSLWLGHDWFGLYWLICTLGMEYEWQTLVSGPNVLKRFAVGAIALGLASRLSIEGAPQTAMAVLGAAAILAGLWGGRARRIWAGAGVLYPGSMLVAVSILRTSESYGIQAVLWLFAVVWFNDIKAYFGGRLIGGPKLWPSISPSKTWAGFLVGNFCGALAELLVVPTWHAAPYFLAIGLLCGVAAQAGDLAESRIKRRFGVKDASQIIPGHGGVMDRMDGFVTAAVLAAIIGVSRGGFANASTGLFQW